MLLGLLLGCDTSTEPLERIAFARDVDNAGRPALLTTRGAVEYRSTFYLPCVPYQLKASLAERSPQTLEIRVVGELGAGCLTMVGSTDYLVRVTALAPGSYTLRVIHSWPDTGRAADTTLTTTVVIP